ncbi:MAG TPA: LEA type 2 family protein [Gemmatimonadaceae bacterium]|nr:LEA type 2 family protein [Gemmatimonadaceae bacterium]
MFQRGACILALAAATLAATACARFIRHEFGNPVVELRDVRLKGLGVQGGSLDLVLDVYNPNNYRLDASRVTYRLLVDTTQVAMGEVNKLVTLETKKKSEVILPVTFTTRELLGAAAAITRTGSVEYTVKGELTVATPWGNFTRPYEGKGRFDSLRPF